MPLPFRFTTLAFDDAVDGLEYKQCTENGQCPEVVSSCDAGRAPDSEHGVNEEQ